jgi:hypothetical protein
VSVLSPLYENVIGTFPRNDGVGSGWAMLTDLDLQGLVGILDQWEDRDVLSAALTLHIQSSNVSLNCCGWPELVEAIAFRLRVDSLNYLNDEVVNALFASINFNLVFDREKKEETLAFFCAQTWWMLHGAETKALDGKCFGDLKNLLQLVDKERTSIVFPTNVNLHWILIVYNPRHNVAIVSDSMLIDPLLPLAPFPLVLSQLKSFVKMFYSEERSEALTVVAKSVPVQTDGVSCGVHMIANALEQTGLWSSGHRFAQEGININILRHYFGQFLLVFSLWTASRDWAFRNSA